jgi:hypothetical protein
MVSVKTILDKVWESPFRIPLPNFYFCAFFAFGRHLRLLEEDFDAFGVIVGDETRIAQLVDERLATAREIVGIQQSR